MVETPCPGFPASWLNAWLAAVGATVLVPGLKLAWSDGPEPIAVFSIDGPDSPVSLIDNALRNLPPVDEWPIARSYGELEPITLNPSVSQFTERAQLGQAHELGWMISSLYTDAVIRKGVQEVDKGPFLTSMPGKANTPADRLEKIVAAIQAMDASAVGNSLEGVGERVKMFGFGFDVTRLGSLADETDHWIDPVVELMAFWGLSLFPVRGTGDSGVHQRGWRGSRVANRYFTWATWSDPLGSEGIDALLDVIHSGRTSRSQLLGVTETYRTVSYQPMGTNDSTRAYGSVKNNE